MLTHTFCHIPGIGLKTEKELWESGVLSWDELDKMNAFEHPKANLEIMKQVIVESRRALENRNIDYFSKLLSLQQFWRIFPHFRDQTAYLDIETTGLSSNNEITSIALYDGKNIKTYINGRNLNQFIDDLSKYRVLVTYNGKNFDLPFIEKYFKTKLNQAHIDLRYILAGLGIKGGLKGSEKHFGISRNELEGVNGFFAVLLWDEYKKHKNEKALESLVRYNIEDTVNLEKLMVLAYNLKLKETPFASFALDLPAEVEINEHADMNTLKKVKKIFDRYQKKTPEKQKEGQR